MGASESILDDSTVINIKCDCVVQCVLISEVHLVELCRGIHKGIIQHQQIPIVIGIPQDQINGHYTSIVQTWQVGFEDQSESR